MIIWVRIQGMAIGAPFGSHFLYTILSAGMWIIFLSKLSFGKIVTNLLILAKWSLLNPAFSSITTASHGTFVT